MGTRHFVNIYKGKTKIISNYGQWDGYLTGQGETIQEFLKNEHLRHELIKSAKKFRHRKTPSPYNKYTMQMPQYYTKTEVDIVYDTYQKTGAIPPEFSRDTGAKILYLFIKYGHKFRKPESAKQYAESVGWCEYIYDIFPDREMIEITDLYSNKKISFTFDQYIKLDLSKVKFTSKKLKAV